MNIYKNRINSLRQAMAKADIAAVVIPQADPHLSEYLAPHWQVRRWLSGFTGSAGDLVVTASEALLWTDSRYFLQAAQQLEGSGIVMMKDGLAETPSIADYLAANLSEGATVGLDGLLFPANTLARIQGTLEAHCINVNCHFNVIDNLWEDRPGMPDWPIYVHDEAFAGESATSKIERVLTAVKAQGANSIFISALDEIAWTLNIRSNDVKYTPVVSSFLYLGDDAKVLFVDAVKLTDDVRQYFASQNIVLAGYGDALSFLSQLGEEVKVLVDPAKTSGGVMDILGCRAVTVSMSPIADFKSVKNEIQIAGVRAAMVRDGAALVRSFMEIEQRLADGVHTTEMDVAGILRKYRSQGENFKDESFGTIAGYGPHGAIVHYEADEESNSTLQPTGLLLVDSGAQYLDGTTDITRTVCLGTPTAEEKKNFTLVMKGHIAVATMQFPDDTRGAQLDALARQFLWRNGMSYLHGTGHGVGHFLGVHEGPQSIRLNYVDAPLKPGMITSNEPGVYIENLHGIRCENLVLTKVALTNEFGRFLSFETLTLFPFDCSLFDLSIMSQEEIDWVNNYHSMVRERLTPALATDQERAWLDAHTAPLEK